ncbi:TraX family protein [Paenibacillus mesotrionivorans]|uniref:TraX family protein n=1 Tax=Paenibacillus mesotrionivorans TaxID=3160968 RepID=A0ACC7NWE5_9BACL
MPFKINIRLSSNAFKVIAIITMFADHLSVWLVPRGTGLDLVLHTFGRLAAPIMCYLIAEGCVHTSNVRKYITRLFGFAVISHFPFVLFFGLKWWQATSVIWGLLLGLIALAVCLRTNHSLLRKLTTVIVCCLLAWTADWNYIAVLWIVFFGILRDRFRLQMICYSVIGVTLYILPGILNMGQGAIFRFGILLAIPLFALYNGQRGKKSNVIKWGFYIFYPAHLLILYIIRSLTA